MCIIVFKPRNVNFPTLETLENCWQVNSHGAGVAIRRNDKIEFIKGLMSFKEVTKIYNRIKTYTNLEVCFHFRLVSAGQKIPEQTHPFPLNYENSLKGNVESLLFHNGTISELSEDETKSDTQLVSELLSNIEESKIPKLLQLIAKGDKFVYMGKKKSYIIGDFQKENGIFYSNNSYKRFSYYDYYRTHYPQYSQYYKDTKDDNKEKRFTNNQNNYNSCTKKEKEQVCSFESILKKEV